MKSILVTGGAGFIGSHAVKALVAGGYKVTVLDNLSKGYKKAVANGVDFVEIDLRNFTKVKGFFETAKFDAVMHFAGSVEVGTSMQKPLEYFENNCDAGMNLLEAMRLNGVNKIIFSSTAAVYGAPKTIPIKEDAQTNPTSIYGQTKLVFEEMLAKFDQFFGFKYVALRYFNAAGADETGVIGQSYTPDTHIIPRLLRTALGKYEKFILYGTDYPTEDGTCVRDYIHVSDLIDAHVLALECLLNGGKSDVFNLANGKGFSNKEVIDMSKKVCGIDFKVEYGERRAGDPPVLIADSSKAQTKLGWKPKRPELKTIVETAWNWHKSHPDGFN